MSAASPSGQSRLTPSRGAASVVPIAQTEPPPWVRWSLALAALVLLHLSHRFSWPGVPGGPLWFPSAGLGLVLVAWFGGRGSLLLFADLALAAVQRQLSGSAPLPSGAGWVGLSGALAEGGLLVGALMLGWWLYHHLARGSRVLSDPTSVVLFLAIIPGLMIGVAGALRLGLCHVWGATFAWAPELGSWWIGQALGIVALAPPLLCLVTPWLIRRGLLVPSPNAPLAARPSSFGPPPLSWREWGEVAGLALSTGALTLLLLALQRGQPAGAWQVWGVPLLVIIWAGLRHGLRAATLAVAVGTVVPLELAPAEVQSPLPFYGSLLAHCAALLVASAVSLMRASEARYRQVAAQIPGVLYSARLLPGQDVRNAEVVFVSPPSQTILGCAPAELLGDHDRWRALVHPEDQEILVAALLQIQRHSQPVTCEYRLAPRPKRLDEVGPEANSAAPLPRHLVVPEPARWLRETLVPHLDHEGRLDGWEGMVLDISEQRGLADDLRRTSTMFHSLVSNLPVGVFFVQAPRGTPVLVNARARQLLGQRENASIDFDHFVDYYRLRRTDGSLYPRDELPVYAALHLGAVEMRDDIVVHRTDGRRVPLVTWAAPVHLDPTGKGPDAAVWVLQDLTALRQAEAARHESEARMRAVIDALAQAIVVLDHGGLLCDCNAAATALLGRPLLPLLRQPVASPLLRFLREDGTELPDDQQPLHLALKLRRPVRNRLLSLLRPRDDGGEERRLVLVNVAPLVLVPSTPSSGAVVSLVDVTQLLEAPERRA